MENEVCKLFALADQAVTRDMSAMSSEKRQTILATIEQVTRSNTICGIFDPIK